MGILLTLRTVISEVFSRCVDLESGSYPGGGGGGGHPKRYVPPKRVWFLGYFGLESEMVFEGTTGTYERIYRFNSK